MKKILALLTTAGIIVFAGPAFKGDTTFSNADNSTFQGHLNGDPWFRYITDNTGNIILFNKTSNNYEYADIDNTGTSPKLVASGTKAGTLSTLRSGNPTASQLSSIWAASRAAIASAQLQIIIPGQWYEVRGPVPVMSPQAQMFSVYLDNGITGIEIQQLLPNQGAMKNDPVHLDGQKLINDSASTANSSTYYTFVQKVGYLEIKVYNEDTTGTQIVYAGRWYSNQADATAYYNTL